MQEVWKDIEGFEGKYQVSNLGNVKSLNYNGTKYARNLQPKKNIGGYLWVDLWKNGVPHHWLIHRLVAISFIDNPNNFPIINHKDENILNNSVDNLEWCDNAYNVIYSLKRKGKYKNNKITHRYTGRKNRNLKEKHIIQKTTDDKFIRKWKSLGEIDQCTNMSRWSISECCSGNRKTAYGYKWEFA